MMKEENDIQPHGDLNTENTIEVEENIENPNETPNEEENEELVETTEEHVENNERPKPTPLPKMRLLIVFTMYVCDVLSFVSLVPYVGFMIEDFNLTKDKRMIGYYAGFLASSYFATQFLSSFFCGWLSDKFGRKPILLFGMAGSCISILLFGFSKWFWMAILARSLYGMLNGNVAVYKTYIAEITDGSNQARAFSLISVSFGIVNLLGPMIGGMLARPVKQYPGIFESAVLNWTKPFFEKFPYFLPNAAVFLLTLFGLVFGIFFLNESNPIVLAKRKLKQQKYDNLEEIEMEDLNESPQIETTNENSNIKINLNWKEELIEDRGPLLACIVYSITGLVQVIFDEIYPLWALLDTKYGGLGFSPFEIGLSGTFSGLSAIIFQLFFCPRIINKFGVLKSYKIAVLAGIPLFLGFPEVSRFSSNQVILWILLVFFFALRCFAIGMMFTTINIAVNNSVSSANMGKINGLSRSLIAFCRTFGPFTSSALFAWSTTNNLPYPLNSRLVYFCLTICHIVLFIGAWFMPERLNRPKVIRDDK